MSNPNTDLTNVIEDALTDSQLPEDTDTTEVETTAEVDAPAEVADESTEEVATEEVTEETSQVATPGKMTGAEKDEFERIAGMPAVGPMGRENRIPYSRVKKITEKAVNELAETVLGRKLAANEKAADVVKSYAAEIPVMREKVTDYEARLTRVGEFEDIIENKPKQFIQMLEQLPQYKEFFDYVRAAVATHEGGAKQQAPAGTASQAATAALNSDAMPEPDQELEDGTKVYSLDGLKALLTWNSQDTERRVIKQVESQYAPIKQEYTQRRHYEAVMPQIRQQIATAKTWPLFDENEQEIAAALEADESLTLEGAYRQVVFPKVIAERNTMRQQVLQEVKSAPRSTGVVAKPVTQKNVASEGPQKLEDIIRQSIATIK